MEVDIGIGVHHVQFYKFRFPSTTYSYVSRALNIMVITSLYQYPFSFELKHN